jgi:formate dehydrogenase iron-sulfur subunit
MRQAARARIAELESRGVHDAQIYDPQDSSVGGTHAVFVVRGDPRTYNLPPNPEVPTVHLQRGWKSAGIAAGLMLAGTLLAFLAGKQQ